MQNFFFSFFFFFFFFGFPGRAMLALDFMRGLEHGVTWMVSYFT